MQRKHRSGLCLHSNAFNAALGEGLTSRSPVTLGGLLGVNTVAWLGAAWCQRRGGHCCSCFQPGSNLLGLCPSARACVLSIRGRLGGDPG